MEELEQEELNERLVGAESVPSHVPAVAGPSRVSQTSKPQQQAQEEDDDDAELRALQAELAM